MEPLGTVGCARHCRKGTKSREPLMWWHNGMGWGGLDSHDDDDDRGRPLVAGGLRGGRICGVAASRSHGLR